MNIKTYRRTTKFFAAIFILATFSQTVNAAIINTQDILLENDVSANWTPRELDELRVDVAELLVQNGVPESVVTERTNALTYSELAEIQSGIDSLPAGQSALGVLGVVFLVLLVLELVGVTNIFNSF